MKSQEADLDLDLPPEEILLVDDFDSEIEHNNERWLISYADMMTLLFGLFVMLYAIAMETQGRPENIFNDLVQSIEKPTGSISNENLKSQILDLEKKNVSLTNQLRSQKDYAQKLLEYSQDQFKKIAELNKQIGELKSQIKLAPETALPKANEQFKDEILALRQEIENLKNRNQQQQLIINNLKSVPKNNQTMLISELQLKNTQMNSQIEELKKQLSNKQKLLEETQQVQKEQTNKIEKLQRQLASEPPIAKSQSFLIFALSWETEKHDLDLIIEDPDGNSFDFENREDKNKTGRMVIDSRTGPGLELWQSKTLKKGLYKITVNFYNTYGNDNPAKFTLTALTNLGEFTITKTQMDFGKSKKKAFLIDIGENGEVTLKSGQL